MLLTPDKIFRKRTSVHCSPLVDYSPLPSRRKPPDTDSHSELIKRYSLGNSLTFSKIFNNYTIDLCFQLFYSNESTISSCSRQGEIFFKRRV